MGFKVLYHLTTGNLKYLAQFLRNARRASVSESRTFSVGLTALGLAL